MRMDQDMSNDEAADGVLDLYHHTSAEAAQAILARGDWQTRENTAEAYASTHVAEQAEGYGAAVVHIQVAEDDAVLDDEFPSGEQHYRVPFDKLTVISAFTIADDGTTQEITAAGAPR